MDEIIINLQDLNVKDKVYFARIHSTLGIYDLCELIIRTVTDTYFVGVDKHDKRARLFSASDINKIVFKNRNDCLNVLKEAEKNKIVTQFHTDYEEY